MNLEQLRETEYRKNARVYWPNCLAWTRIPKKLPGQKENQQEEIQGETETIY